MNGENKKSKFISVGLASFVILVLAVIAYFLFGMRNAGKGPEILINTPPEGVVVNSPVVNIEGQVKNVARISINGNEINLKDGDVVREELILQPGENEFEFKASDKFGNETSKTIKIIYKEN